jgi:hypothetical protein
MCPTEIYPSFNIIISIYRAIAPEVLDSDFLGLQTLRHLMRMTRTWDSTMSMIPKGGETIWGGFDWSPEDGFECKSKKKKVNDSEVSKDVNGEPVEVHQEPVNYGRMVSFGKDVAEAPVSDIEQIEFRVSIQMHNIILASLQLLMTIMYANQYFPRSVVLSSATCQCLQQFALSFLFQKSLMWRVFGFLCTIIVLLIIQQSLQ